jgi:hypothetical protein
MHSASLPRERVTLDDPVPLAQCIDDLAAELPLPDGHRYHLRLDEDPDDPHRLRVDLYTEPGVGGPVADIP